jgi:hypothetical protein
MGSPHDKEKEIIGSKNNLNCFEDESRIEEILIEMASQVRS